MLWDNGEKINQAHFSATPAPTPAPKDDWKTAHKKPWEMNRKFPSREIKIGSDSKALEKNWGRVDNKREFETLHSMFLIWRWYHSQCKFMKRL